MPGQSQEGGLDHRAGQEAVRLCAATGRAGDSLQDGRVGHRRGLVAHLRALAREDSRPGAGKLPRPAGVSGQAGGLSPAGLRAIDPAHGLRHFERRVPVHAQCGPADPEAGDDDDGRHRRASPGPRRNGPRGGQRRLQRRQRRIARPGPEKGDDGTRAPPRRRARRNRHRVCQGRESPVLSDRHPPAHLADAERPVPELRSRHAKGQ